MGIIRRCTRSYNDDDDTSSICAFECENNAFDLRDNINEMKYKKCLLRKTPKQLRKEKFQDKDTRTYQSFPQRATPQSASSRDLSQTMAMDTATDMTMDRARDMDMDMDEVMELRKYLDAVTVHDVFGDALTRRRTRSRTQTIFRTRHRPSNTIENKALVGQILSDGLGIL
ncbi:hypothetical protein BGZ82_002171 [Podila clonocystis]|nr:hypothetical protein BGZ82_002171 [Podila clonocystis]